MPVQWNASMATGINEVDNQHKELFAQVNYLSEAMRQGQGRDKVEEMLDYLTDYALRHFTTEERYMDQTGCPAAAENKRQHAEFIGKFQELRRKVTESGASTPVVLEMSQFLGNWLVEHVTRTDAQLGACVAAR